MESKEKYPNHILTRHSNPRPLPPYRCQLHLINVSEDCRQYIPSVFQTDTVFIFLANKPIVVSDLGCNFSQTFHMACDPHSLIHNLHMTLFISMAKCGEQEMDHELNYPERERTFDLPSSPHI